MQICRRKRVFINCFALLVFAINICPLFSQSSDMPIMSMPEMPSMPSLSMDGSFYKPSFPYVPDPVSPPIPPKVEKGETVIEEAKKEDDLLTKLISDNSTLTASDISNLSDYGLFTDVNSLLGSSSSIAGNASTNILLQEILKQLNSLKKSEESASNRQREVNLNNQKDNENFKDRNPSVLRFKINDYDVKESLMEVFLSSPSEDGSFLLTADRKYMANGKTRTETFYLLFTPGKNGGSKSSYDVLATISQDYLNENSFIYKLCKKQNLTAQKTGNLVVLKLNDKDLKVDLLIDIDKR